MKLRKDAVDITGKKFFDLTALRPIKDGKYRGVKWLCKCICGKECIAFGGHLRAGKRKSCGCWSLARLYESGINRVFGSYKRHAKDRSKEFSISREKFGELLAGSCHYCGREPENELKRMKSKLLQIHYSGIDRYNPDLGYTNENCVSCCYYCNHAKLDLTFDEWKSHLKKIWAYQEITNSHG